MERAPFEWSKPVERGGEKRPRIESRIPTGLPALGQPYIWAAPRRRPGFRYVDDTPKLRRAGSAAFLGFFVLLAFGTVWLIERDVEVPLPESLPQASSADEADVPSVLPDPGPSREPPPVIGTHEPPVTQAVRTKSPRTQAPRPRVPFPTSPPLSQQVMRSPTLEPAPAPPRITMAEAVPGPLPRRTVEEPVVTPPATPSPEVENSPIQGVEAR